MRDGEFTQLSDDLFHVAANCGVASNQIGVVVGEQSRSGSNCACCVEVEEDCATSQKRLAVPFKPGRNEAPELGKQLAFSTRPFQDWANRHLGRRRSGCCKGW